VARDVRIVRDLMLENRDWTAEHFPPYAEERRERMRRLRITALAASIIQAEFGPHALERRKRIREAHARGELVDLLPVAFLGPETLPAEMFSEELLDRLRAM